MVGRNPTRNGPAVRYAVLGMGYISQAAVLPAFEHAQQNSVLAASVSDDSRKLRALGRRYGVRPLYHYDDIDVLFGRGDIDAVGIGLPKSMHVDLTIRRSRPVLAL